MTPPAWKNYALRGKSANGAASPTRDEFEVKVGQGWYSRPVGRKKFKELVNRSDGPAPRFFGL